MQMKAGGADARLFLHQGFQLGRRVLVPGEEHAGGLELLGARAGQTIQHQRVIVAIGFGMDEQGPLDADRLHPRLIIRHRIGREP